MDEEGRTCLSRHYWWKTTWYHSESYRSGIWYLRRGQDISIISSFDRIVVPLNNTNHQTRPTKNDDCSMFTHYPSVLCDHFFIVSNRSWRQPWWLYIITVYHSSSYNLLLRISHSLFPLAENLGNHAVHREVRPWSWSAHLLDLFLNDFFLNIPSFFLLDLFAYITPLSSF